MSGGAQHLRDEGSKQQVVIAGATAGLISRHARPHPNSPRYKHHKSNAHPVSASRRWTSSRSVFNSKSDRSLIDDHDPMAPVTAAEARFTLPELLLGRRVSEYVYSSRLLFNNDLLILPSPTQQALWKGNIPAELLYLFYGGVQFGVYRTTSSLLHTYTPGLPNTAEYLISGATAGGVATTLTYPLDLLRTRFAAQGNRKIYTSLLSSVRDIYLHEGARGYFQGLGAGVGQIVPYMGLFFATYEGLRPPLARLDLPFGSADATAGVLAGVIAKTGVFPLDVVRKRLQVQGPTRGRYVWQDIPAYKGVGGTLRVILRQEGVRGLYRGLWVGLVKAAPTSAITMWTYERALRVLMEWERRKEEGHPA